MTDLVLPVDIESKILLIRGHKVILDRDLSILYEVNTKALKQAVRRNIERFPKDFMFELNKEEFADWRSQFVTSKGDKMGLRYSPMAFTEQGVAMLSSVLKSKTAIQINIKIMRAFVRIRQILSSNAEIKKKLEEHDRKINTLISAVQRLVISPEPKKKRKIGFDS